MCSGAARKNVPPPWVDSPFVRLCIFEAMLRLRAVMQADHASSARLLTMRRHVHESCAAIAVESHKTLLIHPLSMGRFQKNGTDSNRMDLSVAYINANQPGRAIPLLQAAVATDPYNAAEWNNLCLANAMQKDYRTAIEEVGKAPTMSSHTRWRVRGSLL